MNFLRLVLVAMLSLATALPGHAQGLPYDPATATCEDVIAHADDNKATMSIAAPVYAKGTYKGRQCVKSDFLRARELWIGAGEGNQYSIALKDLIQRANAGNAAALGHIRKLEAAGIISETPFSRSRH